ncbi:MAG: hypothetical protein MAG458_01160 [Nitrosopumilus sp.]|nr:hypothetical protein [Nitrosopumilus sp.]
MPETSNVLIIRSSGSDNAYFANSLLCSKYSFNSPVFFMSLFAFFSSTWVFHHKSKNKILFEISAPSFDIFVIRDVASSDCVLDEYDNDANPPILLIFSEIFSTCCKIFSNSFDVILGFNFDFIFSNFVACFSNS